jgi:methylmalonyl-CoA mutase
MTSEYGAPTQLEKIDMLDFADIVVLNKYDKKGSEDALRDVRRILRRTHEKFDVPLESMPVYGTSARYNDEGVNGQRRAIRMHQPQVRTAVNMQYS